MLRATSGRRNDGHSCSWLPADGRDRGMRVCTGIDAEWRDRRCFRSKSERHPRDGWWWGAGGAGVHVLRSGCRRLRAIRGLPLWDCERVRTSRAAERRREVSASLATSTAPYTTRLVVMRPVDPARFSGTVVVEWLNVSGGADAGARLDARTQRTDPRRRSCGSGSPRRRWVSTRSRRPLRRRGDPVRYANLSHPGDSYSYDIFSQAGQAIRDDAATMLGGLKPKHIIAMGESQSAGRMVTYIDAVHPIAHVYDGFLVHSRSATGAPLSQAPLPNVPVPAPAPIRDDLGVPVLVFQTESDVSFSNLDCTPTRHEHVPAVGSRRHLPLRLLRTQHRIQPTPATVTVRSRSSHRCSSPRTSRARTSPAAVRSTPDQPTTSSMLPSTGSAAGWPKASRRPSRLASKPPGSSPVTFATDANGNVLGGIRTPAVDAPVANAQRRRPERHLVLFPLRLHGPAHRVPTASALPRPPSLRLRVDPSNEVRAQSRIPRLPPTLGSSNPPQSTPTSGSSNETDPEDAWRLSHAKLCLGEERRSSFVFACQCRRGAAAVGAVFATRAMSS